MASTSLLPCVPPWPPDLCVVHRDPPAPDPGFSSSSLFFSHPDVRPVCEVSPRLEVAPVTLATAHPPSPSSALWVSKLQSSPHNLKKMASPTFSADGTPIVKAPESVLLRSAQIWKDHIVAQFHGEPPSPAKVFNDLNPIWGKNGRIKVKQHSKGVYMIYIPCELTRRWVLDVAFWHSGNCSFTVLQWKPNLVLTKMKLEFAPVWILFKNIPPELWSFEGFSSFASGVGFPVQSEFPQLKPYSNGVIKLKVVIKLEGKKSRCVKVVDKLGNSVTIQVDYLKLPPKCGICSEFGHLALRCPNPAQRSSVPRVEEAAPKSVLEVSSSGSKLSPKANLQRSPRASHSASSQGGILRRSVSLPGSPVGSQKSATLNDPNGWILVNTKSSSARSSEKNPSSIPTKANRLSSGRLDSEEELISAAQKIIRIRLAEEGFDLPPFSSVADRKRYRKLQRQTYRSLCEEDSGDPSSGSQPSVNNLSGQKDFLAFGSLEAVLPRQVSTFLEA
ncbi:DUF4283 domain-containing protein [Raphanus sativus]|nr:DUF4283 domain-containing protein [Raphanus sativus]